MVLSMKKLLIPALVLCIFSISMSGTKAEAKYYCKNLTYSKAQTLLRQGHYYLDADRDWIACEANAPTYRGKYKKR